MLRSIFCVLTLAVAALAAPHFYHEHPYHQHAGSELSGGFHGHHHGPGFHGGFHGHHHDYPYGPSGAFGQDTFDTRRFWAGINREMISFDQLLQDFYRRFPTSVSTAGYVDGKYKISIPLTGFEEREIAVKAKESLLMIQAVHQGEIQKTYMDIRNLPADVDVKGTWTYDGKALVIEFPVNGTTAEPNPDDSQETSTVESVRTTDETEIVTRSQSREEMDPDQRPDNADADVGLDVETNFIPTQSPVEGTTYSVDVKDDVEFVAVKY